ncbi:hypothetical protein GGX14DRAFT_407797 [Mycena pura]|uniref:Uncharacterized protein n=1 Tax=Mycena pura TaxID=153505 RepID=A0AAD6UQL4_9AGAR|nr:hypothetical protein GGX14DRAFT_407797 [Mycena pura]
MPVFTRNGQHAPDAQGQGAACLPRVMKNLWSACPHPDVLCRFRLTLYAGDVIWARTPRLVNNTSGRRWEDQDARYLLGMKFARNANLPGQRTERSERRPFQESTWKEEEGMAGPAATLLLMSTEMKSQALNPTEVEFAGHNIFFAEFPPLLTTLHVHSISFYAYLISTLWSRMLINLFSDISSPLVWLINAQPMSCTTSLHSWHPVPGAHALTAAPDTRLGARSWTLLFALCHALVAMRAVLTVLLDRADVALAGATMGNCGGGACSMLPELAVSLSLLGALVMALFRELQHRERQSEARSRACPTSSTPARGCGRCTAAALGGVLRRAGGRGGGGGGYAAAAGSGCGGGGWRERRRGSGDGNRSSTTVKWFTCTSIHLIDLNIETTREVSFCLDTSRSTYLGFSLGVKFGHGFAKPWRANIEFPEPKHSNGVHILQLCNAVANAMANVGHTPFKRHESTPTALARSVNHIMKYKSSPWQNIMKLEIHKNYVEFHDESVSQ